MRTCKVKPSASECRKCGDSADYFGGVPNCAECPRKKIRYELLGFTSGLFNTYAIVQHDGVIYKAYIDNVYDVKENKRCNHLL